MPKIDFIPLIQYTFVYREKIKPYVRMTQKSKYKDPQALQYQTSQEAIGWSLKSQMTHNSYDTLPKKTPLMLAVWFSFPPKSNLHKADLGNLIKAVEDAAQGIVYPNDSWVDAHLSGRYVLENIDAYETIIKISTLPENMGHYELTATPKGLVWENPGPFISIP